MEEEVKTEGEGRWWPGWQGICPHPAHSQRRSLLAGCPPAPPSPAPFQQARHFDVLRPSAMNLHNGHALEVLGDGVLKRRPDIRQLASNSDTPIGTPLEQ